MISIKPLAAAICNGESPIPSKSSGSAPQPRRKEVTWELLCLTASCNRYVEGDSSVIIQKFMSILFENQSVKKEILYPNFIKHLMMSVSISCAMLLATIVRAFVFQVTSIE